MRASPSQAALAAVTLFCGPRFSTLRDNYRARMSLHELTGINGDLQREIDALNEDLRRWRSVDYREHIVRDELGWGRRGDLTIVYEELE